MKVFILVDKSDYHEANIEIHGVFSSAANAKAYADKNNLTLNNKEENWHEIEEFTIDPIAPTECNCDPIGDYTIIKTKCGIIIYKCHTCGGCV